MPASISLQIPTLFSNTRLPRDPDYDALLGALADFTVWGRAADAQVIDERVALLPDVKGTPAGWVQATVSRRPAYLADAAPNRWPALRFAGSEPVLADRDHLAPNQLALAPASPITVFLVIRPRILDATNRRILGQVPAGESRALFFTQNGLNWRVGVNNGGTDSATVVQALTAGEWICAMASWDGTLGADSLRLRVGLLPTQSRAANVIPSDLSASLQLGINANNGELDGDLAEVLVFGADLSQAARLADARLVGAYIRDRYGLNNAFGF